MKNSKIGAFIITLALVFSVTHTALGVGQITKPIVVEDVLRGQEVRESLNLFNANSKKTIYELEVEGDIGEWTSIYETKDSKFENPITKIEIPGGSYLDAVVVFRVPTDIPNGTYKGFVFISSKPSEDQEKEKEEGVSASVFQRVGREVTIVVTDKEVLRLDSFVTPVSYDVRSGKPLQIRIVHNNQGNVAVEPDIELKITKDGETIHNAVFPYLDSDEPIGALEKREMPLLEWSTAGQESGDTYRAHVIVSLNDEVVDEEDFRFTIGLVSGGALLAAIGTVQGGVSLAVVVAILLVIFWFVKKRKNTSRI